MAAVAAAGVAVPLALAPVRGARGASASAARPCQQPRLVLRRELSGAAVAAVPAKFAPLKRAAGPVRAIQEDDPSTVEVSEKAQKILGDVKARWDKVEDKPTVVLYTGGAFVALWFSSAIIGAFNSVPLLPKLLELVGIGYTGWFVYRYLLFTPNRAELRQKIEDITNQITGETKDLANDLDSAGKEVKSEASAFSSEFSKDANKLGSSVKSEVDSVTKY